MTKDAFRFATTLSLVTSLWLASACSALPEDIRASLPESLRGDTQALTDYPIPDLSGRWQDTDYPELSITMNQSGNEFTMIREGDYRGIPIKETYQGTFQGRSAKISYTALDKGQIRPVQGKCFGVASKDSGSLELTCEDSRKGMTPLNLKKF
ncbi:hypothetical protein ACUNV4_25585 [Granulosicoccus sp. 3-233]|uniref:hypothetical protein n=1 Tax=Granulosicoccus sp. 3-233 TaxID=3417969 RepID=UPI003D33EB27